MATFACGTCGQGFVAHNLKRRYCSRACSSQAKSDHFKAALRTKVCEACGKPFLVASGKASRLAASPTQRLCSLECQQAARIRKAENEMRRLSQTEAAWIAGFLDGEGSVMLYRRETAVALRVTAANTHRPTLERLVALCGCGSIVRWRSLKKEHKDSYWWQLNAEGAAALLHQILPYLVTKKAQAELAIAFQGRLRDPALKADRTWQHEYLARMKALNRRGPK